MVNSFSKALGKQIPYKIVERRPGDIAECYSDTSLPYELLGVKAVTTIDDMCADALNWQLKNPNGYDN